MITTTTTGWGIAGHFPDHPGGPWKLLGRYWFGHDEPPQLSGYKTAVFDTRAKARLAAKGVGIRHRVIKVRDTVEHV